MIASCNTLPERSVKVLLRNNGNNTFTDVAEVTGVNDNRASWGVVWTDIDNDGWPDLFIVHVP